MNIKEEQPEIDQEEQDFQAALLEDEVDAPPSVPEPKTTDETAELPEGEDEGEEATAEPPEEKPFDPAEEIQRLRSALDKTNGTYGSQLAALRKQIETLTTPRQKDETPAQREAKVEVTADRLAKLKSEFPELAELLAQDLSDILATPAQQAGEVPELAELRQQIEADRAAREEKAKQREIRMLSREHPDWEKIAKYTPDEQGLIRWVNPAFGQWVAGQPEDVQTQILNSDDALELADHITAFKKTLKQTKQSNLNKAIQPKGQPGTARTSALDEEEQLYQEELAREEY